MGRKRLSVPRRVVSTTLDEGYVKYYIKKAEQTGTTLSQLVAAVLKRYADIHPIAQDKKEAWAEGVRREQGE